MRLGIDASNLRGGGGVTHICELMRVAQPEEHGIDKVILWSNRATLDRIPDKPWLEKVHEPVLDSPLPLRLWWRRMKLPKLATANCDLLFTPGGGSAEVTMPCVTMSRNLLPHEPKEMRRYGLSWMFLRVFLLRFSHRRSLRKADGTIFLTEYARAAVVNQLPGGLRGRSTIIPHGIAEHFRRPPRPQKPFDQYSMAQPFRWLYVSIIDVYKHQWHVAKAVALLRQQGFPVTLDLIGPAYPPALDRLLKVIHEVDPAGEYIRYSGGMPYSELTEYYSNADGFVFASSCETFGQILVEAMASGLPIACSNRSAMPELLGDAGLYFDPEEPSEIASALRSLMRNHELREHCASLAHERAKLYSWERCAQETFSFISATDRLKRSHGPNGHS